MNNFYTFKYNRKPTAEQVIEFIISRNYITKIQLQKSLSIGMNTTAYIWDLLVDGNIISNHKKALVLSKDQKTILNALKSLETDGGIYIS